MSVRRRSVTDHVVCHVQQAVLGFALLWSLQMDLLSLFSRIAEYC